MTTTGPHRAPVEAAMNVVLVVDELDRLDPATDTSVGLMHAAQDRGAAVRVNPLELVEARTYITAVGLGLFSYVWHTRDGDRAPVGGNTPGSGTPSCSGWPSAPPMPPCSWLSHACRSPWPSCYRTWRPLSSSCGRC
ncbi:hypothetical protein [Frankia sp. CiP1_Cm_nod1]|uniref:hypothetical protein n=1 Tax=Frankia sp. CiP1_Cm_nod1 TaxID=2897160 RepID=UPI0020248441